MDVLRQKTIGYRTWVKRSIAQALRPVFNSHIDEDLRGTKVTLEYPRTKDAYPAIIVRFFERQIQNAGIGHEEQILIDNQFYRFKHQTYTGDIELAVYALTSPDRDLMSDSIVQTFTMGDLASYTNPFYKRVYEADRREFPQVDYNFITMNTDQLSGYGDSQAPAPWGAEDALVYQNSYRFTIFGEFYSLPPMSTAALTYVQNVLLYPYLEGTAIPSGTADPSTWLPKIVA